jgi:acid stress-induced BolA-like protein IbaG/YrbA
MQAADIKRMIEAGLPGSRAVVQGEDGTHFEATVIYDGFAGQPLLAQHRMVYATLGDNMQSAIHALALRTLTPEQWEAAQGA